jgi:hypothetical protein
MRRLCIAGFVFALVLLASAGQSASAYGNCAYDAYGRLYCGPGGYYGGDPYYGRAYPYRHRYGYDYDPGAAVALGIIGSVAGLMAREAYRHHRVHRRHHHRR